MKTNSDEVHKQEMLLKKIRQSSEVFDKLAPDGLGVRAHEGIFAPALELFTA